MEWQMKDTNMIKRIKEKQNEKKKKEGKVLMGKTKENKIKCREK